MADLEFYSEKQFFEKMDSPKSLHIKDYGQTELFDFVQAHQNLQNENEYVAYCMLF